MSRQDADEVSDADEAGHGQSRDGNTLLIVSMLSAGVLLLIALLYFVY